MKLHEISPAAGSTTAPKRLGRGVGSGLGKTSGKGHKGSKARSGGGKAQGFEGGQMKLVRRIPQARLYPTSMRRNTLRSISPLWRRSRTALSWTRRP